MGTPSANAAENTPAVTTPSTTPPQPPVQTKASPVPANSPPQPTGKPGKFTAFTERPQFQPQPSAAPLPQQPLPQPQQPVPQPQPQPQPVAPQTPPPPAPVVVSIQEVPASAPIELFDTTVFPPGTKRNEKSKKEFFITIFFFPSG